MTKVKAEGTLEDDMTVLYKTKSLALDGTKPNTIFKTNPNPNPNPIQLFYAFSSTCLLYTSPSPRD